MLQPPSRIKIHIIVKDKDGKTLRELDHEDKTFLQQWQAIIAALFKNLGYLSYTSTTTFSCKDTGGTTRNLGGVGVSASPFFAAALEGTSGAMEVALGTGTTVAAYTDYGLQFAVSGATAYPSSISTSNPSGNILYVSFSVTITIAAGATVSEAVVLINAYDSAGASRALAITHDVFTGVAVPAGGSITLNYTFQFNLS
jgi:hypothetical protein